MIDRSNLIAATAATPFAAGLPVAGNAGPEPVNPHAERFRQWKVASAQREEAATGMDHEWDKSAVDIAEAEKERLSTGSK